MSISNFIIQKKLGEGSFSEVYQAKRKSDGNIYAMKKVKMQKLSSKEKESALNEVRILASISHPNVIGYKEAFFEDSTNSLCIVMEHADGGDVLQLINQKKKENSHFSEKMVWHYFIQIIRGLKALHDMKICHRDIKSANLFITKSGIVKLGDLNVSKIQKYGMMRTQTGTPYYCCPEVWKDMPYDNRSDIWSVGCVLYEMITNQPPFRAANMKGLYSRVVSGKFEQVSSHYSTDLRNMITACLQVQSTRRPNCDQILKMPGLLNHLTGTLDDIESMKEETKQLMSTIRLPRKLGMITERMPASKYNDQPSDSDQQSEVATPRMQRNKSVPSSDLASVRDFVSVVDHSAIANLKNQARLNTNARQGRQDKPQSAVGVKRYPSVAQINVDAERLNLLTPQPSESPKDVNAPASIHKKLLQIQQQSPSNPNQPHKQSNISIANRANRLCGNQADLPTIEERAEDMGTGMEGHLNLKHPQQQIALSNDYSLNKQAVARRLVNAAAAGIHDIYNNRPVQQKYTPQQHPSQQSQNLRQQQQQMLQQVPRSAEAQQGKKYKLYRENRENRDVAISECKGNLVQEIEFIRGGQLPPSHDSQTPKKSKDFLIANLNQAAVNGDYYQQNNLPIIRSSRSSVDSNLQNIRARNDQADLNYQQPQSNNNNINNYAAAVLQQRMVQPNNLQRQRSEFEQPVLQSNNNLIKPPLSHRQLQNKGDILSRDRLQSAQRGVQVKDIENNEESFMQLLKRQKESHIQHIERIRRQMPSQQSEQRGQHSGDRNLELMKQKNDQAIQRAIKRSERQLPALQPAYKPSIAALRHDNGSSDYQQIEMLQVPSYMLPTAEQRRYAPVSQSCNNLQPLSQRSPQYTSANSAIINELGLRELRQII